ncbi:MAG: sugar phosphate isomerase/epimerase [Planctomycetes bacterium]|nr:sugar phosphate isomerase/epimerase [Planctomycetota bacterium]
MAWTPDLGVCSWSLQATSVPELMRLAEEVGAGVVQIGLGDPTHGTWKEGADLIRALLDSPLELTAAMIGFPGEDYTSPLTIRKTGGFGDPAVRQARQKIFEQAARQTAELGLEILCSHAGFIPEPESPERESFLECIRDVARSAARHGVIFAMETGQETAALLKRTLQDLSEPNLKVNFDPANMILYDMGHPIDAVRVLGPDIVHVHVKDAHPPKSPGEWGEEVPLGEGDVNIEAFVRVLEDVGYRGPLVVEREVGDQRQRVADIRGGIDLLRRLTQAG